MKKISNPKIIALVTLLLTAVVGGIAFEKGISPPTVSDAGGDDGGT